ncbi:DUF397 domain-containing protein [Streptomyces sp. NPDC005722]
MSGSWSWRKASVSDSNGTQCVEVKWTGEEVYVRHSAEPEGPWLRFTSVAWSAFIGHLHDSVVRPE